MDGLTWLHLKRGEELHSSPAEDRSIANTASEEARGTKGPGA